MLHFRGYVELFKHMLVFKVNISNSLLVNVFSTVIVNMYIAIILENFENILEQDESEVTTGDFEEFYRVWALYDPRATQFVTLEKLSDFLDELRPPFKIRKPNEVRSTTYIH